MTVQMEMEVRKLHSLPVLCNCKSADWMESSDMNGGDEVGSCVKYTSLRDLMPSSPSGVWSPSKEAIVWCSEPIAIKNSLVKIAARAYLQPMASERNDRDRIFERIFSVFSNDGILASALHSCLLTPLSNCIGFITNHILSNLLNSFRNFTAHLPTAFGFRLCQ